MGIRETETNYVTVILMDQDDKEVCRAEVQRAKVEDCGIVEFEGIQYRYEPSATINPKQARFKALTEEPLKVFKLERR